MLYDGHCRFCVMGSRRLQRVAGADHVELVDFQAPGALARFPQVSFEQCQEAMQMVTADGRVYSGAEAVARALELRGFLGLWRLYYLPGLRALVDAAYAWIAARRYRILGRTDVCETGACGVHPR